MSRPRQSGPTGGEPCAPVLGTRYFDTTLGTSVEWDGATWNSMGGGGGGGGSTLLDGSVHTDTQAVTPADGDVVIADTGGYTVASAPGGGISTYLQSPAGGGTAAFAQGSIGDFTAALAAGHDTVGVGGVVPYLGPAPAGWAVDAAMNAMVPLPPGYGWWIKL